MRILIMILVGFLGCKSNNVGQTKDQINEEEVEQIVQEEQQSKTFTSENGTVYNVIQKTEDEWQSELSDQQYYVLREEGTERAFTGPFWDNKKPGIYSCQGCSLPLFDAETKFKSGTGWPSFYQPLEDVFITKNTDYHLGYARTEVECRRCGGHLGHVFKDGPKPTGLRYCINGTSLQFEKK